MDKADTNSSTTLSLSTLVTSNNIATSSSHKNIKTQIPNPQINLFNAKKEKIQRRKMFQTRANMNMGPCKIVTKNDNKDSVIIDTTKDITSVKRKDKKNNKTPSGKEKRGHSAAHSTVKRMIKTSDNAKSCANIKNPNNEEKAVDEKENKIIEEAIKNKKHYAKSFVKIGATNIKTNPLINKNQTSTLHVEKKDTKSSFTRNSKNGDKKEDKKKFSNLTMNTKPTVMNKNKELDNLTKKTNRERNLKIIDNQDKLLENKTKIDTLNNLKNKKKPRTSHNSNLATQTSTKRSPIITNSMSSGKITKSVANSGEKEQKQKNPEASSNFNTMNKPSDPKKFQTIKKNLNYKPSSASTKALISPNTSKFNSLNSRRKKKTPMLINSSSGNVQVPKNLLTLDVGTFSKNSSPAASKRDYFKQIDDENDKNLTKILYNITKFNNLLETHFETFIKNFIPEKKKQFSTNEEKLNSNLAISEMIFEIDPLVTSIKELNEHVKLLPKVCEKGSESNESEQRKIVYNECFNDCFKNLNLIKELLEDDVDISEDCIPEESLVVSNVKNKVNMVRGNQFNVNKPQEGNMKYKLYLERSTFILNSEDEGNNLNLSGASKIVIGEIEAYKDIIEQDKINNFRHKRSRSSFNLQNQIGISKKNFNKISTNNNTKNQSKNVQILDEEGQISDLEIEGDFSDSDDYDYFDTINDENDNQYNRLFPYHISKISFCKIFNEANGKVLIRENVENRIVAINDDNNKKMRRYKSKSKKKFNMAKQHSKTNYKSDLAVTQSKECNIF